jgi:ADP-ribose pyrophosphatase YjhB (NUDIX family)
MHNISGTTPQVKRLHEVAQPIFTAEVYILHDDSLLMFKRSENKKKFPGFWSIPGGHIDEGEDPATTALREVQEETGVLISPQNIKLKVVAMHHHLDRGELYVAFAFVTHLNQRPHLLQKSDEGTSHWVKKTEAMTLENVFPPIRYYFEHVLLEKPGIIYNQSQWLNTQLVKVLSESVDTNG